MTKDEVRQALERVLTWPPERQEDVVKMLEVMEEQDHSNFQLTDEQAAEVRRELENENPETITFEQWRQHLRAWTEPRRSPTPLTM